MKKITLVAAVMVCVAAASCDDNATSEISLSQLNSGPAGSNLSYDSFEQRAVIHVGTALAFDCRETVLGSYRSRCEAMAVSSDSVILGIHNVYRPKRDDTVNSNSAFAMIGISPGVAHVRVGTANNLVDMTVIIEP
jgi:hypothetical protein